MSRPPSPPPALQGFVYVEPLGTGGFADVFLYEQQLPKRRVAVKVLLADRLASGAAQEFAEEANVMAMLSTHPAIVTIYQAGVADDGRPYLVMEYCPRPNLQQRARTEPFSVAEALRVGVQVAGAVETAHRAGVLHRDIKPANILVTAYNRPALTDFGIASTTGAVTEATGMSIPWSPPESFAETPRSGPRTDVYALGATLYTLLTGRSPFERPGERNGGADLIARIENDPLPPLGRADVPDSLVRVLERAMAKNPDDRFPSAVAFARALQKVQIELSHSVTPVDIVDEHPAENEPEDDGDGLTRVREVVSIEPGDGATRPSATTSPISAFAPAPSGPRFDAPPTAPAPPVVGDVEATMIRPPAVVPAEDDATVQRAPRVLAPEGVASAAPAVEPAPAAPVADPADPSAPGAEPDAPSGPRRRAGVWIAAVIAAVIVLGGGSALAVGWLNSGGGAPSPAGPETAEPQDVVTDAVPAVTGIAATSDGTTVTFTWSNPSAQTGDTYLWNTVALSGNGPTQSSPEARVTVPAAQGQTCIDVVLRRADGRGSEPARGCTS